MNSNEFEGAARDIKGHVKDGVGGLTGDTSTRVEGKLDQAAGKFQRNFGETVDNVSQAAGQAASRASDAAQRASEMAGRAGSTLRDTAESVRQEAQDLGAKASEAVSGTVKEYPLLSLIGMAAIGYLTAFLIHSPSTKPTPMSRYYRR